MSFPDQGGMSRTSSVAPPTPKGDTSSLRRHHLPFSPFGAENVEISFTEIRKYLEEFNAELKKLSNEAMQLGRVSGLLWSIKKLRKQLSEAESAFLLNAASLNPDIYHSDPQLISVVKGRDYEQLPLCLHELSARFQTFWNRLDEFHERTDEGNALRDHLDTFIRNVKYRAHCIEHYQGRLNTIPIQQYVHQLARELATGLHDLLPALEAFIAIGVPAIRYEQKRASDKFFNMSTVATLFSGVTASTLQMSVSTGDESLLMFVVNVLWLCALVFSVGATLNSLLSMAWRQSRAGSRAPVIISWWIASSPAAFLVLAISSFSAGLIGFAYASKQAIFTAPLTIAATSVTFVGLIGVVFGMFYERWMSKRRYTLDKKDIGFFQPQADASSIITASTTSLAKSEGDWFEEEERPNMRKQTPNEPAPSVSDASERSRLKNLARNIGIQHLVLTKLSKRQLSQKGPSSPLSKPQPTRKLKKVVDTVVAARGLGSRSKSAHPASRIMIPNRFGLARYSQFSPNSSLLAITCIKEDRYTSSTWTAIYDIQSDPILKADMWHKVETSAVGKGVIWSPDGKEILVRFDRELQIWNHDQHAVRTLRTRRTIKAVIWLDANTILTAESNRIHKQSRSRRTMGTYELKDLNIRDMAVEPTHNYLIILVRVKASSHETLPMAEQKQEKRIVVYDMDQKSAVYQLPVLEDILSIQISRSGLHMLVSAHQSSFQAWQLDVNLDSSNLHVIPILRRLTVVSPDDSVDEDYDGPVTFGGILDDFVFSATDAGKIQVWYRNPSTLELRPSYLLSLGSEDENEEAPMIQQLTWRPFSPTFAVTRHNSEGASIIQLWMAQQPTPRPSVPAIRTMNSQGSTISMLEIPPEGSGALRPLVNPAIRSPPSPSIAHSVADVAARVRSQHKGVSPAVSVV